MNDQRPSPGKPGASDGDANPDDSRDTDPRKTRASLLQRVRDPQDKEAWSQFVNRYGPMILTWTRRWFPQDADDVKQDVFTKLVSFLPNFEYDPRRGKGKAPFRGLLKTMTRRLLIDLKRRPRPVLPASGDSNVRDLIDEKEAEDDLATRLAAEYDLELAEIAETRVRLRVKDTRWKAYEGTDKQGRKPAEVARELGIPVARVSQASYEIKMMIGNEISNLEGSQDC